MDCPFIESDNPRCSQHLNLGHLEDAFALCTDQYDHCPVYLQTRGLDVKSAGWTLAGAHAD
jgi:hypothetical protein